MTILQIYIVYQSNLPKTRPHMMPIIILPPKRRMPIVLLQPNNRPRRMHIFILMLLVIPRLRNRLDSYSQLISHSIRRTFQRFPKAEACKNLGVLL